MTYVVKFVDEDRLPIGQDWALIREGSSFYFVAKRERVTPLMMAEGWAAYRLAVAIPRLAAV